MGLELCDCDEELSLVLEVAEGGGCDVEPVEDVAWAGSVLGASSGQYQPGMA